MTWMFSIASQVCFLVYCCLLFDLFFFVLISLEEHKEILSVTSRLRAGFLDISIHSRVLNLAEPQSLKAASAIDVVFEAD